MILLCEVGSEDENIFKDISDNFKINNYNNSIDLFSFIWKYIFKWWKILLYSNKRTKNFEKISKFIKRI